jgi:hypothetical protein
MTSGRGSFQWWSNRRVESRFATGPEGETEEAGRRICVIGRELTGEGVGLGLCMGVWWGRKVGTHAIHLSLSGAKSPSAIHHHSGRRPEITFQHSREGWNEGRKEGWERGVERGQNESDKGGGRMRALRSILRITAV